LATEVLLPKLGMNMESATIVRWCKAEGDTVAVGEVLAEVETDKATVDLEAETAGVLRKLLVAGGEKVALSQPVALIGAADEDIAPLLRQRAEAPVAPRHVERVYEAWRGSHAGSPAPVGRADVVPARTAAPASAPAAPRLDPEAIRARLAQRGVLDVAARPAPRPRTRIVIYGAGLGAKQLLEVTRHLDQIEVVGLIDDSPGLAGTALADLPVLGGFAALADLFALGAVDGVSLSFHSEVRRKVHRRLVAELGIKMVSLIDPRAHVGMDVEVGDGALIEAGAIVGPGTVIGEGAIVDIGAVVAHDCMIGPFSHLSPGCRLSGVVSLTENVLVGVGAALNSTVTVGRNVIITPGAAVMNDVPDDVVVGGVPAKVLGQSRRGG
jgi:sugar O-acyltransferase (sialic acid O-acetyltransferase NeuD family)